MNALPITPNAVPVVTKSVSPVEAAPQGQPFGQMLAQQVAETQDAPPAPSAEEVAAEVAAPVAAIKTKTADEIFDHLTESRAVGNANDAALVAGVMPILPPTPLLQATSMPVSTSGESIQLSDYIDKSENGASVSAGVAAAQPGVTAGDERIRNQGIPAAQLKADTLEVKKDAGFAGVLANMNRNNDAQLTENKENKLVNVQAPSNNLPLPTAVTTLTAAQMMPAQLTVNAPVTQREWGDEFNQKITWIATSKEQTAELHLNPPQLGPMDVVLKVSGDQATALFTSPHAVVREAIEQALPKLREMLADNGIMLGNATVSDQASRHAQDGRDSRAASTRNSRNGSNELAAVNLSARVSPIRQHNGIVDTFA